MLIFTFLRLSKADKILNALISTTLLPLAMLFLKYFRSNIKFLIVK